MLGRIVRQQTVAVMMGEVRPDRCGNVVVGTASVYVVRLKFTGTAARGA